jgi:hypothetical protein
MPFSAPIKKKPYYIFIQWKKKISDWPLQMPSMALSASDVVENIPAWTDCQIREFFISYENIIVFES